MIAWQGGLPIDSTLDVVGMSAQDTLSYPDFERGEGGWCHDISFITAPHGCTVDGTIRWVFILMSA